MNWILALTIFFMGCARGTPFAPVSTVNPVRWDLTAPGCAPRQPLPVIQANDLLISRDEEAGMLTIAYKRPLDLLYGEFQKHNNVWALCFWDTSDN
jgi:hypothetical protein